MAFETNGSSEIGAGYDLVVVPESGGRTRSLSRKQFESLPLRERVAYLIDGTAQFFLKGQPVQPRDAMRG
jgi:hypothetical protein